MTPPTPTPASVSATEPEPPASLIKLLSAFQFLQGQNLQLAAHLSSTLNIGPTDLRVMLIINTAPSINPKTLATRLDHTTGSITALIDRLEKMGHVQRRKHPTDRRSQTLHLTDTGVAVVHEIRDVYATAFNNLFNDSDTLVVTTILRTLGHALGNHIPDTA